MLDVNRLVAPVKQVIEEAQRYLRKVEVKGVTEFRFQPEDANEAFPRDLMVISFIDENDGTEITIKKPLKLGEWKYDENQVDINSVIDKCLHLIPLDKPCDFCGRL